MKQLLSSVFLILLMHNLQGQDTTFVRSNKFFQLPYHASFSRLIERCTPVGNDVYTSEYEMVQLLPTNGSIKDPVKRTFFRVWTRKNGQWKLITSTND